MMQPIRQQLRKSSDIRNDLQLRIERITNESINGQRKALLILLTYNKENAVNICDHIDSKIHEINISQVRKTNIITHLINLSKFSEHKKTFKEMTKADVLAYLDTLRKSEEVDPRHGWIGTYSNRLAVFIPFFKWLYYPDIAPKERKHPAVCDGIKFLKRKEWSKYTPADIWTPEENAIFLKYCPSERNKAYHSMAYETGFRPHEGLKIKMRDIQFMVGDGGRVYAFINVNGKTGSRQLLIIDAVPYVKDWWATKEKEKEAQNERGGTMKMLPFDTFYRILYYLDSFAVSPQLWPIELERWFV